MKYMESIGFGKKFEEKPMAREEARLHERFCLGDCVVDGAMEAGRTDGEMVVEVSVTHWRQNTDQSHRGLSVTTRGGT